jgi:hypothetical protein
VLLREYTRWVCLRQWSLAKDACGPYLPAPRHTISDPRGRLQALDPNYRHAMPVLEPIESCRRARSSGVGCAKITHMNRTVAASNSVNVSTTRMIDPRPAASRWLHRGPSALQTNTLGALGQMACAVASTIAVVTHRQRPPNSHATTSGPRGPTMKARFLMSMTSNRASRVPQGPPVTSCGFAGGKARFAAGNYRAG